jgi:hypothetical protein
MGMQGSYLALGAAAVSLLVGGAPGAATAGSFERAVIPHQDGSGRATIVEIDPGVPGAGRFIRATPEPIPAPGELILAPTPVSTPRARRRERP